MKPLAPSPEQLVTRYWRANLILTLGLLVIWALVSFGAGILWADRLADVRLGSTGYPLGFWFAQQGSIIVFVFLVLAYAIGMNTLDRRHKSAMEAARQGGTGQ